MQRTRWAAAAWWTPRPLFVRRLSVTATGSSVRRPNPRLHRRTLVWGRLWTLLITRDHSSRVSFRRPAVSARASVNAVDEGPRGRWAACASSTSAVSPSASNGRATVNAVAKNRSRPRVAASGLSRRNSHVRPPHAGLSHSSLCDCRTAGVCAARRPWSDMKYPGAGLTPATRGPFPARHAFPTVMPCRPPVPLRHDVWRCRRPA